MLMMRAAMVAMVFGACQPNTPPLGATRAESGSSTSAEKPEPSDEVRNPMAETQELARTAARDAFIARGVPSDAAKQVFTIYDLLLDEAGKPLGVNLKLAGPFVFFNLASPAGRGPQRPQQAIAVEVEGARVWDRNPEGFAAWVKAYGIAADPTRLGPELILRAYYILAFGTVPTIQKTPTPSAPETIFAPTTEVVGTVATTIGWTQTPSQMDLTKHVIRIHADGKVETSSTPAFGGDMVAPH